jgi:hypothetical protein
VRVLVGCEFSGMVRRAFARREAPVCTYCGDEGIVATLVPFGVTWVQLCEDCMDSITEIVPTAQQLVHAVRLLTRQVEQQEPDGHGHVEVNARALQTALNGLSGLTPKVLAGLRNIEGHAEAIANADRGIYTDRHPIWPALQWLSHLAYLPSEKRL